MKVIAHRGYSHKYPESTRIAYEEAVKVGVDGFECDVRLSRNKEIVCFHDFSTRRISGKFRLVSLQTTDQLRKLVNVLTLNELLDIAINNQKNLLIETKHPIFESFKLERKVVELLDSRKKEIEESRIEVIVMSFSFFAVQRLKRMYPNVAKVVRYQLGALLTRERTVAISIRTLRKYPRIAHKLAHRRVYTWTVNSKSDFHWVRKIGRAHV